MPLFTRQTQLICSQCAKKATPSYCSTLPQKFCWTGCVFVVASLTLPPWGMLHSSPISLEVEVRIVHKAFGILNSYEFSKELFLRFVRKRNYGWNFAIMKKYVCIHSSTTVGSLSWVQPTCCTAHQVKVCTKKNTTKTWLNFQSWVYLCDVVPPDCLVDYTYYVGFYHTHTWE